MLRTARLAVLAVALSTASATAYAAASDVATSRRASAQAIRDYLRARLADSAGDVRAAIESLRLALVHDPESPQLRISYAEALARAGRLSTAEAEARRAVDLAEGNAAAPDAHRVLGKVLLARGRVAQAETSLGRAIALEAERVRKARKDSPETPEAAILDPEAWRVLADTRMARRDATGAATVAEDLARLEPATGAALLREIASKLLEGNEAPPAETLARRATEIVPSDPSAWRVLAEAQEAQGHVDEARQSIGRALTADPSDPESLLSAGQLSLRQGDLPAARAWFQQLLRVAPDERAAQLRVATTWLESKRPADALEAVAAGDAPEVLYLRGVALVRLRRWPDAIAALERVDPSAGDVYPPASALLGHALSRLGRSTEAIRAIERGLAKAPRDSTLLFALGEAYDRAGDREAALAQMRKVIEVSPDHAEAMNYLGYAYAERGERLDEAEVLLTRALATEPENAYYLDSLGWILLQRRDVGRAVETLERAAALAPELTILDHLGDAYRAAQRPGDAAGAYRKALQSGEPDDDEPGLPASARRAVLQKKLEDLGAHDGRAANLRR